jgi:hypothetical protein
LNELDHVVGSMGPSNAGDGDMSDEGRKLSELYEILEDMEESLPDEEMKSKELIGNLKDLNQKTPSAPCDEKKDQIAEMPEEIVSALITLKKTLDLISPQANGGDAVQFEQMKRYIDEILFLFNSLNAESDWDNRAKLTAAIKEAYRNISLFLGNNS